MEGVLILAHGSRENRTEDTMNSIARMVREKFPDMPVEVSYMEFRGQTIEKGIERLIAAGADDVKVIPYFLFEGIHIRQDIPEELEKLAASHPGVKLTMGRTLGEDSRLADILADRIRECTEESR